MENIWNQCKRSNNRNKERKNEKKVKRARDTLTRTQSRTIFMFNLFVKWKYTSANNQQSHIWNRQREHIAQRTERCGAMRCRAEWSRTLIRMLVRIGAREFCSHVCAEKMMNYFHANERKKTYTQTKWFTLFLCQFHIPCICVKRKKKKQQATNSSQHSIEIAIFHFYVIFIILLWRQIRNKNTSRTNRIAIKVVVALARNEIEIPRKSHRMKMNANMIWIHSFPSELSTRFHPQWQKDLMSQNSVKACTRVIWCCFNRHMHMKKCDAICDRTMWTSLFASV